MRFPTAPLPALPLVELLSRLQPPSDALGGGVGEDVLDFVLPEDAAPEGAMAVQDSLMPSLWISARSSSIVCRTKAA